MVNPDFCKSTFSAKRGAAPFAPGLIGFKLLGLLLFGTALTAGDGLYFMDLAVTPGNEGLTISGEPVQLISNQVLYDESYDITPEMRAAVDAPFQFTLSLLEELDQRRGAIVIDPDTPVEERDPVTANLQKLVGKQLFLASFDFSLTVRDLRGQKLDSERTRIAVGLSEQPGHIFVSKNRKTGWLASFASLQNQETYREFLSKLVFPYGNATFLTPKEDAFLIELTYKCFFVRPNLIDHYGIEHSQSEYKILRRLFRHQREEQLGVTACFRDQGHWEQVRNGHLKFLRQTFADYQVAREKTRLGTIRLDEMEALIARAPADPNILELLVEAYLKRGILDEPYERMIRLWPIVEKTPKLVKLFSRIEKNRSLARRQFMDRRVDFPKATDESLNILTPGALDFIGGATDVVFTVDSGRSDLVQAELFANQDLVDVLENPPGPAYRFNFDAKDMGRNVGLRIRAYFRDETFQEKAIPVRTISLNDQETIQLISLRTVVTRGQQKFLVNLNAEDFTLRENAERREIISFKKDTAPLRVAILMDTSSSMAGDKLYHAQFAVNSFLTHLEPQDSGAVYTFDDKVLRFTTFTNDFATLRPLLFTLRPQLSTSLYDALVVAQNDLRDKQGTQVIIVVSDGSDSSSTATADQVMPLLHNTNVIVYSIILGRNEGIDKLGARFLTKLSKVTGSITTEVAETSDLDQAFKRIYEELKSYYFIDFYSNQERFALDKIKVDVRKMNAKARFRQHLTLEQLQIGSGFFNPLPPAPIQKVNKE